MIDSNGFKIHSISASALFILGNAVILLPEKNASSFTFFSFLAVSALAVVLYALSLPIYERIFMKNGKWRCLIFLIAAIFSFWVAADAFYNSFSFVKKVILPETARPLIILAFLIIVLFFFFRRQEEVLKFSLLAFAFILGLILIFLVLSAKNFKIENILISSLPDFKTFLTDAKPYLLNPVVSLILLPIYFCCNFKKINPKPMVLGVLIGFLSLGACIVLSLLIFGAGLAGSLEFPFSYAISTVTVGKLFTRMDGFAYFIYFSCALIKITICLNITALMVKKIRENF